MDWPVVAEATKGLSYAEIARACDDAARRAVLGDHPEITNENLLVALEERRAIHKT